MRNFSQGAAVELIGGDTLRLILRSPTGEQVYHDLTPAEAEALREMPAIPAPPAQPEAAPAPVESAPAATTTTSSRKKTGKET